MSKYNHKIIESKWQRYWAKHPELFEAKEKSEASKQYILDMFPYPSSDGLHCGHVESYTATDITARYWRLRGKNVLHPQGWDAFGLPAENYAVKTKTHPAITTARAIKNFKRQMNMLGLSYDWSREVNSSDPEYYKWTQWFFLLLYKNGLAYRGTAKVNWCLKCQTVLANEQAEGGACERCGTQVIQKDMEQWFFKITDFIEDRDATSGLISGLDKIDWPDSTKAAQKNWIGKSEGAEFEMEVAGGDQFVAKYEQILLATNNLSKKVRVEKLLKAIGVQTKILTPKELGLEAVEAKEAGDLFENAKEKAELYRSKTDLPVLGIDTGFSMQGEEIDPVKVKRNALKGKDEKTLSQAEIGKLIHEYYKDIVKKRGGKVDAYWQDMAALSLPDGTTRVVDDKREVLITDKIRGEIDMYFPLRSLYISKATGKYIADQTDEDELIEQKPFIQTLIKLLCEEKPLKMKVFTTRLDTVFGMTFTLIAPEHELVEKLMNKITNWPEVEKYRAEAKKKSELQRMTEAKDKTGVELKGIKVINPFTKKEIPLFVSDFVLAHYGTGAVMAVPAHDERDFEFAKKFNLPIDEVVKSEDGKSSIEREAFVEDGILINSEGYNAFSSAQAREKMAAWLERQGIGKKTINYKMRDWLISRQRYWGAPIPIIYCSNPDCHSRPASVIPAKAGIQFGINSSGNPGPGSRVKPGMTNLEYETAEYRMAVIDGEEYSMIPVPEEDLPVKLPKDVDFMPHGESPLVKSKTFHNVKCPVCGAKARRESDTMDTFVCSSWYYLRYGDPKNKKEPFDKLRVKKWLPVDLYVGGAEHTVLHLLYARFFTKVLHNLDYIDFDEPFAKMRHQGIILGEDGEKMSKSQGNVINPDTVVAQYGADALRMFEMFMGPLEDTKPWNTKGIIGISRFLERIWKLKTKLQISNDKKNPNFKIQISKLESLLHKTIKKVGEDIEKLRFNTAISALMILLNAMEKDDEVSLIHYSKFLILLSPFAPHITEEIWSQIGHKKSIFLEKWPEYGASLVKDETIELVVQINGKVRARLAAPAEISEVEAKKLVMSDVTIQKWLAGREPKKMIFVKGRLVNIVI